MKPVLFPEHNNIFGHDQPAYVPLPVRVFANGEVVHSWSFDWFERLKVLITGRIYIRQLTFNSKLQPIFPSVDSPFKEEGADGDDE